MENFSSTRFFKLVGLCLISLLSSVAHASTLQTYTISTGFTDGTYDYTYTFDVTTNDGCTSCSLGDLTSTSPLNQTFTTTADPGYDWYVQYPGEFSSIDFTSSSLGSYSFAYAPVLDSYDNASPFLGSEILVTDSTQLNASLQPIGTVYPTSTGSTIQLSSVPLPSSALLFGSGLLGLVALRRKGKVRNA